MRIGHREQGVGGRRDRVSICWIGAGLSRRVVLEVDAGVRSGGHAWKKFVSPCRYVTNAVITPKRHEKKY